MTDSPQTSGQFVGQFVSDAQSEIDRLRAEIEQLRLDKTWLRRDIAETYAALREIRLERDRKDDDAWELRNLLKDILDIEAEGEAIGGGPGWAERRAKAYAAAWERFEP